ncbi:amidohydrolase family protein [Luminiphilus sp.]|nr:amidohydrolase family protein [Luminiphilus sp.]
MGRAPYFICAIFRVVCAGLLLALMACGEPAPAYDVVINHGRVIDPESQLDAVRSIGTRNGKIVAVSKTPLSAPREIDASNRVVISGFINLHSHSVAEAGYQLELLDGVTTVLELEAGGYPIDTFGQQLGASPLTHFGASVGHAWIRLQIIDPAALAELMQTGKLDMSGAAFTQTATPPQREQIERLLERELDKGGLGIGFLLDYMTRAVDDAERDMIFAVAARHGVPVFVHVRRGIDGDPSGLLEVIETAERYGAAVHICHLNASAMSGVDRWLDEIDAARARGVDVTTEMFPWTAGSASISSDVFSRDWREIFAIDYTDVQWAETGEWLTEESFQAFREARPEGQTMHHYIREEWNRLAIQRPHVMVASDAMPLLSYERKVVPNGAGTSARILGQYVREEGLLSLSDAIARLSLFPAMRMQAFAPAFFKKGRISVGADADLVIFDPASIAASADYDEPFLPPAGIDFVLVGGSVAAESGAIVTERGSGKKLLGARKEVSGPSAR